MIGVNSGVILVLIGLFLFGLIYDSFIGYIERRGYLEGLVSLSVVVGVLVTLAGIALIDWLIEVENYAALIAGLAFSASGIPMVTGSLVRFVVRRNQAQKAQAELLRGVARDGNKD